MFLGRVRQGIKVADAKSGSGKRDIQTHLKTNTVEANVLRGCEKETSQPKTIPSTADFLSILPLLFAATTDSGCSFRIGIRVRFALLCFFLNQAHQNRNLGWFDQVPVFLASDCL